MTEFTPKQVADFKKGFALYDFDGDGKITTKELGSLLRSLGGTPTNAEIAAMVKEVPEDGLIDFQAFLGFMGRKGEVLGTSEELLNAFRVFDKENTGKVSTSELQYVLSHLAEPLEPQEAADMAKEMDPQNTGSVDYKEYVKLMLGSA